MPGIIERFQGAYYTVTGSLREALAEARQIAAERGGHVILIHLGVKMEVAGDSDVSLHERDFAIHHTSASTGYAVGAYPKRDLSDEDRALETEIMEAQEALDALKERAASRFGLS